jgi:hypothetical protein
MTADVGLPAAQATIAYFEGDADRIVSTLLPIRRISNRFGGSHAQRDLLARMLVQAAIDSGQHDLARALVDERLMLLQSSTFALDRRAVLAANAGDSRAAGAASDLAVSCRDRFAAAADRACA